jgi:hypothetical protein
MCEALRSSATRCVPDIAGRLIALDSGNAEHFWD